MNASNFDVERRQDTPTGAKVRCKKAGRSAIRIFAWPNLSIPHAKIPLRILHPNSRHRRPAGGEIADTLTAMKCTLCEDCGWVCEEHPERPWGGKYACICGGAGAPCPRCNVTENEPPRMPEGFRTEIDKDGWRH
jgi:hypothetical protein